MVDKTDPATIKKAKDRIRQFVETNKPVARCRKIDDNTFEYKVKHYKHSLFFKRNKLGHLRLVADTHY